MITNTDIFPEVQGLLLVSWLLPLLFTLVTISICFALVRIYRPGRAVFLLLPLLLWIPFVRFHTGLRRQSLGIVYFALTLLVVYLGNTRPRSSEGAAWKTDTRYMLIGGVGALALGLTHHVSSILLGAFGACFLISLIYLRYISGIRSRGILVASITIAVSLITRLLIQIITGSSVLSHAGSLTNLVVLSDILSSIGGGSGGTSGASLPYTPITTSLYTKLSKFLSMWIYQIVLAIPIVLGILRGWSQQRATEEQVLRISQLLFGVFIGLLSVTAWLTSTIDFRRVMTVFVLSAGWLSLDEVVSSSECSLLQVRRVVPAVFVAILVLLSILMVPPHLVSDQPPAHQQGVLDQRFPQQLYATGGHIESYPGYGRMIGDSHIAEVVGTRVNRQTVSKPEAIIRAEVPSGSSVLLQQYNDKYYSGSSRELGSVSFSKNDVFESYSRKHSKVYSNGQVKIYR